MTDLDTLYLTTRELASLLRIGERKVYELVANDEVPCSRATGKLLFPRQAVERWLAEKGSGFSGRAGATRPDVILGSHDPLLDWAIHASGCGIATSYDGSSSGLRRFAAAEGILSGLHLPRQGQGQREDDWNTEAVAAQCGSCNAVLVEFAWRERGLLLAPGNPHGVEGLRDLARLRLASRQEGAGAEVLLDKLLTEAELDPESVDRSLVAHTETEAATAITAGEADVALGLHSLASQHQLDFVPVTRERYDLLVDRRAWFEPPCQSLFAFLQGDAFRKKVDSVPGYDCSHLGQVRYNLP